MIQDINFSKYKRFFVFGCSFTGYLWPTWADILEKEMPSVKYYNMGISGAGNLMIISRLTETNLKFKFTEEDLVMIMWTTFCREDRYFQGRWNHPGNIFTQDLYDKKFVKNFADPKGYLIRDLTLITQANAYIKSLPCDSICLSSVPFNYQNEDDDSVKPILEYFKETVSSTPPCMFDLELNGIFENGHEYYDDENDHIFHDYHPNPLRYRSYLEKLGFPLTDKSKTFAEESYNKLKLVKNKSELKTTFINNMNGNYYFNRWW